MTNNYKPFNYIGINNEIDIIEFNRKEIKWKNLVY